MTHDVQCPITSFIKYKLCLLYEFVPISPLHVLTAKLPTRRNDSAKGTERHVGGTVIKTPPPRTNQGTYLISL